MIKTLVALGLTATVAAGAGPYVVKAGNAIAGTTQVSARTVADPRVSSKPVDFITSGGVEMGCASAEGTMTFHLGKTKHGYRIGKLTRLAFQECIGPAGMPLTIRLDGPAYVSAYGKPSRQTGVYIQGSVTVEDTQSAGAQCSATITGNLKGVLNTDAQTITWNGIAPADRNPARITRVEWCGGLGKKGETVETFAKIKLDSVRGPLSIIAG